MILSFSSPQKCTRPSRRRTSRMERFCVGSFVVASQSRKSSIGAIHSSPFSIIASMLLSRSTTVQTQQPNRLLPHDGVLVSTTSGHSPAFAFRYIATRSLFLFPHGDGRESR